MLILPLEFGVRTFSDGYRFHYPFHRVSVLSAFGPQATTGSGKMPERGKRGITKAQDSGSHNPKKIRSELPETDNHQLSLHALKWNDLSYNIVWEIFGCLNTMQKLKYRRVSSTWNNIQLQHISASAVLKLGYVDFKHWETIFCPPARETRRAVRKREVKLVTGKTRWVIMDFRDTFDHRCYSCSGEYFFSVKDNSCPPLQSLAENHPQIHHVLLFKMEIHWHSAPMPDYQYLKDLGCSPNLGLTVMVYDSAIAQRPPFSPLEERRMAEEMEALRGSWPWSITLDGEGNDYWRPLRDLYMAYWPYPPDQLQWLEECVAKVPTNDSLFRFLDSVKFYNHVKFDFDEKTAVLLHGHYRERSVLAICAVYLNIHRTRLDLPPPPHALT